MEQRLARQAHNLEVVGSIPTGAISILKSYAAKSPILRGFLTATSGNADRWSPATIFDRAAVPTRIVAVVAVPC